MYVITFRKRATLYIMQINGNVIYMLLNVSVFQMSLLNYISRVMHARVSFENGFLNH